MAIGDVFVLGEGCGGTSDVHYVDVGLFDVPEFGAVYLLDAERPAIVDAGIGTDYELVLAGLDAVGIDPAALEVVALTHVHLDHAGGAGYLVRECPDADVYAHRIGAPHVVDPARLAEGTRRAVGDRWPYYPEPVPVPEGRVVPIEGGDTVDLGDRTLDVHHVPGHAPHQVVFHEPDADVVFTGDAAGIYLQAIDAVQPTSPPPNFDLEQCLDDVETIRSLGPDVLCYPHYGPVETGSTLDEYEDVLAEWVRAIEAARNELPDEDAIVDHLVELSDFATVWGEPKARPEVDLSVRGVLDYLERREAPIE